MVVGAIGGAFSMYYIGAYIKIAAPQLHPTATLGSGGISAMAFFYLVSTLAFRFLVNFRADCISFGSGRSFIL